MKRVHLLRVLVAQAVLFIAAVASIGTVAGGLVDRAAQEHGASEADLIAVRVDSEWERLLDALEALAHEGSAAIGGGTPLDRFAARAGAEVSVFAISAR